MKRVVLLLLLLAAPLPHLYAGDFWIDANASMVLNTNNDVADQAGTNYKMRMGYKYLYGWVGLDGGNSMEWGGQPGPEYTLGSVGVGLQFPLLKYLNLYGEFGRFFFEDQDKGWQRYGSGSWEGIHYSMVQQTGNSSTYFDQYRNVFNDAWGGEVGVIALYPLAWGFNVGAHVGYRFLQVERNAKATWDNDSSQWWQFHDSVDMNAWVVGVGLQYEF